MFLYLKTVIFLYYTILIKHTLTFDQYLGNLHTPVEEVLGADVILVLFDVVEQAAVGHELGNQLHRGGQANSQKTANMGIVNTGHNIGLLYNERERHTF